MKLRIHGNSLRLRLSRSDVAQLQQTGMCRESLRFASGSQLDYTLEASSRIQTGEAQYTRDGIRVLLPLAVAEAWAGSDEISLPLGGVDADGPSVSVEKDFHCLHRGSKADDTRDADADTFPNPAARD